MNYEFGQKTIALERGAKSSDAIVALPDHGLFMVVDGGHEELASEAAQDILLEYLQAIPADDDYDRILERIREAFEEANERILEMKSAGCFAKEPLISASVALLRKGAYLVGHLGNTKAFLYRNQILRQLTRDHSAVGELQRQGLLRKEDMEKHPARHQLTRHLAGAAPQIADLASGELFDGDVVILASDGLIVADDEVIALIEKIDRSESCAERLAIKARAAGAKDDVSVLMIRVSNVNRPEGVEIPQVSPRDTQSLLAAQVSPVAAAAIAAFQGQEESAPPEGDSHRAKVSDALNALEKSMATVDAPAGEPPSQDPAPNGTGFEPDSPDELERQKQLLYERFMNYAMKNNTLEEDASPATSAESDAEAGAAPSPATETPPPKAKEPKSPSEEQKQRISQALPLPEASRPSEKPKASSGGDIWGRVQLDSPEEDEDEPDFLDSTAGVIFCALTGLMVVLAIWMY